jgi:hypothetical protein
MLHHIGGVDFLPGKLGVAVQLVPERDDLFKYRREVLHKRIIVFFVWILKEISRISKTRLTQNLLIDMQVAE